MKMTYLVSVSPKRLDDSRVFWFQKGKLTDSPDRKRNFSSHKSFRTTKKLESFCRWLDNAHPDTVISVLEIRPRGRNWAFKIPMGE